MIKQFGYLEMRVIIGTLYQLSGNDMVQLRDCVEGWLDHHGIKDLKQRESMLRRLEIPEGEKVKEGI